MPNVWTDKAMLGADDEHVDVFVKPGTDDQFGGPAFVVNQQDDAGEFDEHKILLGWTDADEARRSYLQHYPNGWESHIESIAEYPTVAALKVWLDTGDLSQPAAGTQEVAMGDEIVQQEPADKEAAAAGVQVDAVLKAAQRNAMPANKFAVPGKRKLPIHDKTHVMKAWQLLGTTKGLSADEKKTARSRILAAMKRYGIQPGGDKGKKSAKSDAVLDGKAFTDALLDIPDDVSLSEFRTMLEEELQETQPGMCICDVYSDFVVCWRKEIRRSQYDGGLYETYSDDRYKVPYSITDTDDEDGDIDEVNIQFGEPVEIRYVPKEVESGDTPMEDASGVLAQMDAAQEPGDEVFVDQWPPVKPKVLSDAAERSRGILRIQLKGPKANEINGNNRVYPLAVLTDAIQKAARVARSGLMVAYEPHPRDYRGKDGLIRFEQKLMDRVGTITDCTIDRDGQSYFDYSILDTPKGQVVKASIDAGAPIGTSVRSVGQWVETKHAGRNIEIAKTMRIYGNDFVDNPALDAAWQQATVLTDAAIELAVQAASSKPDKGEAGTSNNQGAIMANKTQDPKEPASSGQADDKQQAAAAGAADTTHVMVDAAEFEQIKKNAALAADPRIARLLANEEQREKAEAVKTFVDKALAGEEVVLPGQDKPVKIDLSRFDEKGLKLIRKSAEGAMTDSAAWDRITGTVETLGEFIADKRLAGMGYIKEGGAGVTAGPHVEVMQDEAEKVFDQHTQKLVDAIDRQLLLHRSGFSVNKGLRERNKPFIDSMFAGIREHHHDKLMMDSARDFLTRKASVTYDRAMMDAADTTTLLNQAYITPASAALITQMFQDLSWLNMISGIGPEGFTTQPGGQAGFGNNLRIPVEPRPSGDKTIMVTAERAPVSSINGKVNWLNFSALWRKIGFVLTQEAKTQLQEGPARYDALARQLYIIAEVFKENIDLVIANECLNASDEYLATPVVAESHVNGDVIVTGALATLAAANGYGNTVVAAVKITTAVTIGANAPFPNPICPQRHTVVIQEDGSTTRSTDTILNPTTCTGASTTQVLGILNSSGQIVPDPDNPGTVPTFAVDFENGIFVFNAASGIDATHPPALTYSYVKNIDYFDLSPSASAADIGQFYDGVLRFIDNVAAVMGSQPRYRYPTDIIFNLVSGTYPSNARMAAQLFQPKGSDMAIEMGPNSFGTRKGVRYNQVNTPWRCGSNRALIGQPRATKYGVQFPWSVLGPIFDYSVVGSVPTPTGADWYIGQQNSVICTPVGFDTSPTDWFNFPYRSIRFVGQATL
jgi:hypothetical protein